MVLSIRQAYLSMFNLLDGLYDKTKNDCLGSLLGGFNPHLFVNSMSADSAAWNDWNFVIKKITDKNSLTSMEALQATKSFIQFHIDEFGFDLNWLIKELNKITVDSYTWINCVENILKK